MGNPGIVSIGHEIKLETAAEYFSNDIIFGNLEPAIVQTGMPDEVYEATKKNIQEGKGLSGGYIFSAGCELPPRSPVENIKAMNKAVNDFGWYD
jgi:uroporphyrinogen decarboxylase